MCVRVFIAVSDKQTKNVVGKKAWGSEQKQFVCLFMSVFTLV